MKLLRTCLVIGVLAFMVHPVLAESGAEAVAVLMMKFDKSSKLSDRDEIWSKTLQDVSMLGNGRNYFEDELGIGAHNSVIEMLGKYGIPAGLGILLIGISSLYSTFRYHQAARTSDLHSLTPFLITVGFWILASGEMMVGPLGGAMNCCFLVASGVANFLSGHPPRCVLIAPSKNLRHALIGVKFPCAS